MTSAARIYAKPFPMHYTIAMTKVGLIILQLILLFISMDVPRSPALKIKTMQLLSSYDYIIIALFYLIWDH